MVVDDHLLPGGVEVAIDPVEFPGVDLEEVVPGVGIRQRDDRYRNPVVSRDDAATLPRGLTPGVGDDLVPHPSRQPKRAGSREPGAGRGGRAGAGVG
jgi:hypothetical protein